MILKTSSPDPNEFSSTSAINQYSTGATQISNMRGSTKSSFNDINNNVY
jgi:hypothetical protein